MPGAIDSKLDASVLNAMRVKRRVRERQAEEKLRLLRRLRRRHGNNTLPKETSAEASFIEQFFAKIFDYSTLLSNDDERYFLCAKPYVESTKRFPDGGLGAFRTGSEDIFASIELKGSGTNLDEPESCKGYNGLTPVQQAFRAVKGRTECLWVLVSNMKELRLYMREDLADDKADPPSPIVQVDLREVYNRNDLAMLCAHFDRAALLGPNPNTLHPTRSELMKAYEKKHPAQPLAPEAGHVRLILVFTPSRDEEFALFWIESRLRKAVAECASHSGALGLSNIPEHFKLENDCIVVGWDKTAQGTSCQIRMSGEGQLYLSMLRAAEDAPPKGKRIDVKWLVEAAGFFFELAEEFFRDTAETPGFVSAELREVKDIWLKAEAPYSVKDLPSEGKAESDDVMTVDFRYKPHFDAAETPVADVVSELSVYFRSENKDGGVVVNREAIRGKS